MSQQLRSEAPVSAQNAARPRLVMLDAADAWHAGVIRGIADSRTRGRVWRWMEPRLLVGGQSVCDYLGEAVGVITDVEHARAWTAAGCFHGHIVSVAPRVVTESGTASDATLWWHCHPDVNQACRDAVDSLHGLGFRCFSYLGCRSENGVGHEIERYVSRGELEYLPGQQLAADCVAHMPYDCRALDEWVRSLARPIAIIVETCRWAELLYASCLRLGVAVPDEVAILSVEDDDLVCEFHCPAISSVDGAAERVGQAAAALLNALIHGAPPPDRAVAVPVGPPKLRASTDALAVNDTVVIAALRYIRENVSRGIRVKDVLGSVPVSRRVLEQKFRVILNRTPADEIRREQIMLARRMIDGSNLPITRVAHECGFASQALFSRTFRRFMGITPSTYRKRQNLDSATERQGDSEFRSQTA